MASGSALEPKVPMGLHFNYRGISRAVQPVVCALQHVTYTYSNPQKGARKDTYEIPHYAIVDGRKYPMRIQSPPLTLKKFKEVEKKWSSFAIMGFEYKSALYSEAAGQFLAQLMSYDNANLKFLFEKRATIWPDKKELSTMEEVKKLYRGFTSDKIWVKPKERKEEKKEEASEKPSDPLVKEVEVKEKDGKIIYEPVFPGESKKRGPEESDMIEPSRKKRKADVIEGEAVGAKAPDAEKVGGGEISEDDVRIYPPEFTVFPLIKKKAYMAKLFGPNGEPKTWAGLMEGSEIVSIADCRLIQGKDGVVTATADGQKFYIKQLEAAQTISIATDIYEPESVM